MKFYYKTTLVYFNLNKILPTEKNSILKTHYLHKYYYTGDDKLILKDQEE